MKVERRIVTQQIELRKQPDAPQQLRGYAAVFNRETVIAGLFREQIAPGAFTTAIDEDDVRALWNHDPNFVLGRTTAGTLRLREDDTGLDYEVDPPATQWAQDLLVSIGRGDVTQSSFGFQVVREEWREAKSAGELPVRTILEARLFDVSPVTYPAYEETTAEARSQAQALMPAPAATPQTDEAAAQLATELRRKRQSILEALL